MSQVDMRKLARKSLTSASLRQPRGARTVLLRMAADEERAERIRQLKTDHPGVTWASIAEAIGVKERSAVEWARTGGISYENAKRLAAHFSVDVDWLWRGGQPPTPDLIAGMNGKARIDDLETHVTGDIEGVAVEFRQHVIDIREDIRQLVEQQAALAEAMRALAKAVAQRDRPSRRRAA